MLVMFRAKNFLSFKDEVILDFRKSGYREHKNHTFAIKNFELLKTIAIYGANASGKSNLICALSAFIDTVRSQFFEDDGIKKIEENLTATIAAFKPFLLTQKIDSNIEFEIVFINNDTLFQYGFIVEKDKKMKFLKEWLFIEDQEVFTRSSNIVFGEKYKELYGGFNKVRDDRLLISTIDYFAVEPNQRKFISIMKDFFIEKVNVHFEIYFESSIKGLSVFSLSQFQALMNDKALLNEVKNYVKKIDVGIADFDVQEIELTNRKTNEKKKEKVLKTIHNVLDEDGKIIDTQSFDLEDESSGTKRFISFINNIISLLDSGGVYIIDELSSSLHPILTKFIIDLFQSKINQKNAQLIFTTHETTIMNKHQFRRDEIVIVDKNNKGESFIYSLADIDVRSDATYDSDYFKGKYGGIPIIADVLSGETFDD